MTGRRRRLHLPEAWAPGVSSGAGSCVLGGAAYHYLAHVLRVAPGQPLILFDGSGRERAAEVERVDAQTAWLRLSPCRPAAVPPPTVPITLLAGLTRGGSLDRVTREATELGVHELGAVVCERSVAVPPAGRRRRQREQRLQRIAATAAAQCGRADVPGVGPIRPLAQALAELAPILFAEGLGVVAHPGSPEGVGEALSRDEATTTPSAVVLLVGPEGGLTRAELAAATDIGFRPVSLGPRVLRAETAATTLLALAQHVLGGLAA